MKKEVESKSCLANLFMREIKEKRGAGKELDEFLKNSELCIIDPDLHEQQLLSDTPDDELDQMTLFALKKIVEKRTGLIKKILNKQTLNTKRPCFTELDGIVHIKL